MVGEIRDRDTAEFAIQASLTGQLLLGPSPGPSSCPARHLPPGPRPLRDTCRSSSRGQPVTRPVTKPAATRRAGRKSREWYGRGSLINTVTGQHIADVSLLERCSRALQSSDKAGFVSERVLVYCAADGARLSEYKGRKVPVLRYVHNVSLQSHDGGLMLRAIGGDGQPIASAHGVGRGPIRIGLRTGFELSVRPAKRDAAAVKPPQPRPMLPGTARAAVPSTGGPTREEYKLIEPVCPGGSCTLHYRRTGRCPSWYGGGLCTLEVNARSTPVWARWWRRVRAGDASEKSRRGTAADSAALSL
jgi:hypothetical protein